MLPLLIQVGKSYLLWGLRHLNLAYFGLFGSPRYGYGQNPPASGPA